MIALLLVAGCAAPVSQVRPSATYESAPMPNTYHIVKKGQTLWGIARAYGLQVDELVRANDIANASRIRAGQRLSIPGAASSIDIQPREVVYKDNGRFEWPVSGKVISTFGSRRYDKVNKGIDISSSIGADVIASRAGRVAFVDEDFEGYGKTIILEHNDGFSTVYAYNSEILAKVGENIRKRQVIAKAGSSGRADRPLLHFEIRKRHKPQNPFYYLP